MRKIEFLQDAETPDNTGWWINEYDGEHVVDSIGPFDTKEEAEEVANSEPPEDWLE